MSLVILYSLLFVKQNLLQFKSRPLTNAQSSSHPIFQRAAAVFAAHSIFLGFFTFFFAHVQVTLIANLQFPPQTNIIIHLHRSLLV